MTLAEAIGEWEKKQGFDKAKGSREMRTVKVSHEDMVFLRALVHPQPPRDEYETIVDGCTISLWESEFDDRFSIGAYESDSVSCILTYDDCSEYCDVFRLTIRERESNEEHSIVWSEVEFIEKRDDAIVVTGCRRYEMTDGEPQLVQYDVTIVETEAVQ